MDMFSVFGRRAVFTVRTEDTDTALEALSREGFDAVASEPCRKVSIVGAGMHGLKGVMARFSAALARSGIDMLQTVDSHATISALVSEDRADEALRALHAEFIEEGTAAGG